MYALFKDDKQISKAHPVRRVAWIEAMERKIVFGNKWKGFFFLEGWKIKSIDNN